MSLLDDAAHTFWFRDAKHIIVLRQCTRSYGAYDILVYRQEKRRFWFGNRWVFVGDMTYTVYGMYTLQWWQQLDFRQRWNVLWRIAELFQQEQIKLEREHELAQQL